MISSFKRISLSCRYTRNNLPKRKSRKKKTFSRKKKRQEKRPKS